jgi:hypothetical protein
MIHIEILTSSDSHAIGLYEFEFDEIYIGRSKKNDLIFLDRELPMNFMLLQIVEDSVGVHLVARSVTRTPFFYINKKKVSGTLKIHPNDVIAFGDNTIRVVKFLKTKEEEDLSLAFDKFAKNASELRFSLDFIEEVLLDLETKGKNV